MTDTLYVRSRGDYRAENNRLRDVAKCAARMLERYSWADDVQRHFSMEPVAAAGYFRDLDVAGDWRALFESLIVAGNIEPDHLGLPDALGSSVFLRLQAFKPAAGDQPEYWRSESMFEVLPGALTYAMVDAAAVELYYRDQTRAVRIVRDVCPTSARLEYLQGMRDLVSDSQVIGLLEAGATPELVTGYAVIADASENPDGEGGSAFWPARIVLQGVPGPMGARGPRGYQGPPGVGGGGAVEFLGLAGGGGRHGHNSYVVDPHLEGVGYVLHKFIFGAEVEANTGMNFSSAEGARDYALWWLHSVGEDQFVYMVEHTGSGWLVECFTGNLVFDPASGDVVLDEWPGPVVDAGGVVETMELGQDMGAAWLASVLSPPVNGGAGEAPAWVLAESDSEGWHITKTGRVFFDGMTGRPLPDEESLVHEAMHNDDAVTLGGLINCLYVLSEKLSLADAMEEMQAQGVAGNPGGYGEPGWYATYSVVSVATGQVVATWSGGNAEREAEYTYDEEGNETGVSGLLSPLMWAAGPVAYTAQTLVESAAFNVRGGSMMWVDRFFELSDWGKTYLLLCGVVGFDVIEPLTGRARVVGGAWVAVGTRLTYQGVPLSGPELGVVIAPGTGIGAAVADWLGKDAAPGGEWSAANAWCVDRWGAGNFEIFRRSTIFIASQ